MPADFNTPAGLSTAYASVLSILKERDVDALTLCITDPSNIPANSIKYNRVSDKFQERLAGVWTDKVLSVAGGGTGGATAAAARTALGIGSMGVQNSGAIAVTGGTMSGVSLNATDLVSGTVPLLRLSNIADANIAAAAAIAWTKVSKTGSSLADLITRSAGDLTSGTLSNSRMPATIATASFSGSASVTAPNVFANADLESRGSVYFSGVETINLAAGNNNNIVIGATTTVLILIANAAGSTVTGIAPGSGDGAGRLLFIVHSGPLTFISNDTVHSTATNVILCHSASVATTVTTLSMLTYVLALAAWVQLGPIV